MGNHLYAVIFFCFLFIGGFSSCDEPNPDQQALEKQLNGKALPGFSEIPPFVGVFQGTLPCADCEGILTQIAIEKDSTYKKSITYLGKDPLENTFSTKGKWTQDGEIVWLDSAKEKGKVGFVCLGDSAIHLTDAHGKIAIQHSTMLYRKQ